MYPETCIVTASYIDIADPKINHLNINDPNKYFRRKRVMKWGYYHLYPDKYSAIIKNYFIAIFLARNKP